MAQRPVLDHDLLIIEDSLSQPDTTHSVGFFWNRKFIRDNRIGCEMTNQIVWSVQEVARHNSDKHQVEHYSNRRTTVSDNTFVPKVLQRCNSLSVTLCSTNLITLFLLPHSLCACIKLPAAAAGISGRRVSNEPCSSSSCKPRNLSSSTPEVFTLRHWKPSLM
jgi:hypothetical protein